MTKLLIGTWFLYYYSQDIGSTFQYCDFILGLWCFLRDLFQSSCHNEIGETGRGFGRDVSCRGFLQGSRVVKRTPLSSLFPLQTETTSEVVVLVG